jgi:acyl carrier protein
VDRTEKIRQYIEDRFLIEFDGDITDETDLFKAGVMDSFGYLQLMDFLEHEFSVKITPEDILTNVFVSLLTIDDFVANKLGAGESR